jgi:hypothetical protein
MGAGVRGIDQIRSARSSNSKCEVVKFEARGAEFLHAPRRLIEELFAVAHTLFDA